MIPLAEAGRRHSLTTSRLGGLCPRGRDVRGRDVRDRDVLGRHGGRKPSAPARVIASARPETPNLR